MGKWFITVAVLLSSMAFSAITLAAPIHISEYHYGQLRHNPLTAASCGNILSDHLLIRKASSCNPFVDMFSLATFEIATIDYLEFSLNFAATNNSSNCLPGNCALENWQLNLLNASGITLGRFDLLQSSSTVQQTFVINRLTLPAFADLFSQGKLWFGFTETSTSTSHSFRLSSSRLAVFALPIAEPTPVPLPATLVLFSLGLLGFTLRQKFSR